MTQTDKQAADAFVEREHMLSEAEWASACTICSKPRIEGELTCGSEGCEHISGEISAYYREEERQQRRGAILATLRARGRSIDEYSASSGRYNKQRVRFAALRAFYTFKTLVCLTVLYRRQCSSDGLEMIGVASFGEKPAVGEYTGVDWIQVDVALGILSGWTTEVFQDCSY